MTNFLQISDESVTENLNIHTEAEYYMSEEQIVELLKEGSLDACKYDNWEEDWFCKEIAHALKTKRNIIPILLGGGNNYEENVF